MSHEHTHSDHGANGAASSEVLAAEERVRQAREELRLAEEHAENLRRQDDDVDCERPHSTTIGAVVDDVLTIVKKYPIPSIVTAASIGFFLGRLFRR